MFIIYGWKEWMKSEGLVAALWKLSAFRWIALRNIILTIRKQDNLRLSSKCFLQPNLELDNWIGLKALGAGVTRVFDGKNTAVFHFPFIKNSPNDSRKPSKGRIGWNSMNFTRDFTCLEIFQDIFHQRLGGTCFGRWWKTPPDPTMIKHDKNNVFHWDHVGHHKRAPQRGHALGPCPHLQCL